MMLEYEKSKYKEIKEKLIDYRQELGLMHAYADKISDPETSFMLTKMYERMINLYDKNKLKPYFAKLVFNQKNQANKTIAYIGRIGFANLDDKDIIVDWRAPIAELYYNSKLGETSFKVEKEVIEGTLELKRQINFENGEIVSVYDVDNSISSDEFLQPYLSNSADNRLKNIVATIQSEQDQIIREPISKDIIVQGVAGSGKTTVALHRLSYLIYNNRNSIKAEDYLIISPNKIFKKYIVTLLEDLDADLTQSKNVEEFVLDIVKKELKILNKHEQYNLLKEKNINSAYLKYKSSKEFISLIDTFVEDLEKQWFSKDLIINDIKLLDSETMYEIYQNVRTDYVDLSVDLWSNKVSYRLMNDKMIFFKLNTLCNDNKITFKQKLDTERLLESGTKNKVTKFFNNKVSIFDLYKNFIKNISTYSNFNDIKTLKEETLKNLNNNKLSFDDLGAILYLYSKIFKNEKYLRIKHVLIDEAQDFSYVTFTALKNLFKNATFSIFGDIAQGLYNYQSIDSWKDIDQIFSQINYLNLNKSYRSTIEITQEANKVLKELNLTESENVVRHGQNVRHIETNDINTTISSQILQMKENHLRTIAIICKDNFELNQAQEILKDATFNVYNENSENIDESLPSLLTVESSKGLEFDGVIIYNISSYNNSILDLKKKYVALTRPLHEIYINTIKTH